MRRTLTTWALTAAGIAVLGLASRAQAVAVRLIPLPERVALANTIVVGKVTAIEDKTVSAHQFPGAKDKVDYTIAVVEVKDPLLGAKGMTHLKIGFVEPKAPAGGINKEGGLRRPGPRFQPVVLAKDQEGCFLLNPHFEESFYIAPSADYVLDKSNPNHDKDLEIVRNCAKLLSDPDAGLKSKNADDRATTAGLLIIRYRTAIGPKPKEEKIDAEQSKLILQGLADGDWSKPFSPTELTAQTSFGRLNLSDKDAWKPGPFQNFQKEFPEAAKKWLKDNADTYRIKRFVDDSKDPKDKK
jgi:hypothetical protein